MQYAIVNRPYDANTQAVFFKQAARLMDYRQAANYAATVVTNQRKAGNEPYVDVYNDVGFRGEGTCGYQIIESIGGSVRYYDKELITPEVKYIMAAIRRAMTEELPA